MFSTLSGWLFAVLQIGAGRARLALGGMRKVKAGIRIWLACYKIGGLTRPMES